MKNIKAVFTWIALILLFLNISIYSQVDKKLKMSIVGDKVVAYPTEEQIKSKPADTNMKGYWTTQVAVMSPGSDDKRFDFLNMDVGDDDIKEVTFSREILEHLGLKKGDYIAIFLNGDIGFSLYGMMKYNGEFEEKKEN